MFENHMRATANLRDAAGEWTSHRFNKHTWLVSEPLQRPEGALLERLRIEAQPRLSARAAAKAAGMSGSRWTQIVRGYKQETADLRVPVRAPADTLARMAKAVGATPDQLREVGRDDAADELELRVMTVRERAHYERAGGQLKAEVPGLGAGLASSMPSQDEVEARQREAVATENDVLENNWSAVVDLVDTVVRSEPTDELLTNTKRIVFIMSGYLIVRILRSGYAAELESWLERIYVEREALYENLSPSDERRPWYPNPFDSEKSAAQHAVREFGHDSERRPAAADRDDDAVHQAFASIPGPAGPGLDAQTGLRESSAESARRAAVKLDERVLSILRDQRTIDPSIDFVEEYSRQRQALDSVLDTPAGQLAHVRLAEQVLQDAGAKLEASEVAQNYGRFGDVDDDAPPPFEFADAARTGKSVGRRIRDQQDAEAEAVDAGRDDEGGHDGGA